MRATVQQTSRGGRRADCSTTARCGSNMPKRIIVFPLSMSKSHVCCSLALTKNKGGWRRSKGTIPMAGGDRVMYGMVTAFPLAGGPRPCHAQEDAVIMHFAILIYDEPDSAALRDQYRQAHLDYLTVFDAQTLFAGPFTTDDESADLGSLRLIEFPDRATADRHVAEEPYVIGGVQKRWYIHRWLPRLPYS